MAAHALTPVEAFGFTTPVGPYPSGDAAPQDVLSCYVTCTWAAGGGYVVADGATITGIPALIQDARRNGKTVTLISVAGASPGLDGTTPMMVWGGLSGDAAPGITIAAGVVTAKLTSGTLVAQHAVQAMGACNRPLSVFCTFKEV